MRSMIRNVLRITCAKCPLRAFLTLTVFLFSSQTFSYSNSLECLEFDPTMETFTRMGTVAEPEDCDDLVVDWIPYIATDAFTSLSVEYVTTNDLAPSSGSSTETMPTVEQIVEAVGSGFILVLPLFLVIFGGRAVLSMLFPNKFGS